MCFIRFQEVYVTTVNQKNKIQALMWREARSFPAQVYVQDSAWTHFQDDVIVDRNAVMHGNIQSQVHVLNSCSAGEFCSQAKEL